MLLRDLILSTAAATEGVGKIEETLKWGEPAYLTSASKSGSTIRIAWKAAYPSKYAMYFKCHTTLIDSFRTLFPNDFVFEGNRRIVFAEEAVLPTEYLSFCIAAALTYHICKNTPQHKLSS
ncbi:DUF1801 domain-containing protein [Undibacterium sp. RTI2.1]|uniref:DUF1801 domain-containing protein n=1 Tax=unclassified Undibacterium TaxID=2630295 RepID=UPI002AB4222B|nr:MULTISPECIES: DUF1801 domain-containing protein [unclassified Undibacterium]MDY7539180.1 DUF1801 domain-containing protein [Undibacterium sp. 5I1]MEB0031032.1 DUF1801 domain-containing protein [Undibacterium sp. RTI2.1]MEB0116281.1 DUF1801 domain-containing protein [Undibacterium sp. RTI2.2]MEB0231149.1 DUF1801 domain-containing protein [Undibacterium sp. 10I3]MEB0257022.1 DUF1801 domain-containing protein [Undibacterium sp. 5I1]